MRELLFAILFLFAPLTSLAGPTVNNGGGGWRCTIAGKTSWIKAVDLINPVRAGVTLETLSTNESAFQIYKAKKEKLLREAPHFAALILKHDLDLGRLEYIDSIFEPIGDAFLFERPEDKLCKNGKIEFVQIANYLINERLVISKPIWDDPTFSERDKAAILLHELLYKVFRKEFGDENSYRAREAVLLLFSRPRGFSLEEDLAYLLDQNPPNRNSDHVPPFNPEPRCVLSVKDLDTGESVTQIWKNPAWGKTHQTSLKSHTFYVQLGGDGIPNELRIEHDGQVSSTVARTARSIFLALGEFGLSFSDAVGKTKAELQCWVYPR
jgi:hypothetical protein